MGRKSKYSVEQKKEAVMITVNGAAFLLYTFNTSLPSIPAICYDARLYLYELI